MYMAWGLISTSSVVLGTEGFSTHLLNWELGYQT